MTEIKASEIKQGMFISLIIRGCGVVTSVATKDGKIFIRLDNGAPIELVPYYRVFNVLNDEQLASLREFHLINFGDNVTVFETMFRENDDYYYTGRYLVRVNGERTVYDATLAQAIEHARLSAIAIA